MVKLIPFEPIGRFFTCNRYFAQLVTCFDNDVAVDMIRDRWIPNYTCGRYVNS